ncbi:MAG TPA: hypothetical protein VK869_14070 [Rubrobacteraceae bacterium]|nr:hypothetical protein [Rubrobacteraceae bacterium]
MKTRLPAGPAMTMWSSGKVASILANVLLVASFVLQASHPENGFSLGAANDLVGSLATAFMIPVALSARLPDRRSVRIIQAAGLTAMAFLTVGGPLLTFEVQSSPPELYPLPAA